MEQLELLWKLQKHDFKLKETKAKLEELAKKGHIENITLKLNSLEKELNDKKLELEKNDKKLRKNDGVLKGLTFQLKETEKNLYNGTVTDLKQLNYMVEESENLKDLINELELEIILLMEDIDGMRSEIFNIEDKYNQIKAKFEDSTDEYNNMTEEYRNKIRQEMECIYRVTSKIDANLYKKYTILKDKKVFAIAKVEGNRCNGCNMIMPTYLVDNLKSDEELQYCENCGRILYMAK